MSKHIVPELRNAYDNRDRDAFEQLLTEVAQVLGLGVINNCARKELCICNKYARGACAHRINWVADSK